MNELANFKLNHSLLEIPERKGDPRLAHLATLCKPEEADIWIAGYADDEGVKNNGGRPGAKDGPEAILKFFLKMTPPAFQDMELPRLHILGTNTETDMDLFGRLESAKHSAQAAINKGKVWIGLGGGHDYGYSDGSGFLEVYKDKKPLIINFDAHLDVRPFDKDHITSGTPFSRLYKDYPDSFDFIEIGVQDYCNSKEHAKWVKSQGGQILTLNELRSSDGGLSSLQKLVRADRHRSCFLSIDIDAFSSSFAMGCSQSWPTGMTPKEFWPLFKWICESFAVKTFGIYEVSPPLDSDNRTAKLAAEILYCFLIYKAQSNSGRSSV